MGCRRARRAEFFCRRIAARRLSTKFLRRTDAPHTPSIPAVSNRQPLFAVRQADATDIPLLAHHRAAMFRDMGQLAPHQEETLKRATASYLVDAVQRGEYLAWVAEDKGTTPVAIGGAGVQLRPILPRPRTDADDLELGPEAIVLNVYVEPAWRRRGVAEALMRAVLDALAERGTGRIVLHASDEGRRLYQRLGFVPTNEMRLRARARKSEDTKNGTARARRRPPRV
jgi:ribosomal protein S18 acetylase RimI-like enzyme